MQPALVIEIEVQNAVGFLESEALVERIGALTWMHDQIPEPARVRFGDHRFHERPADAAVTVLLENEYALHIAGEAVEPPRLRNAIEDRQPGHADGTTIALRDVCNVALPDGRTTIP